jgi:hypothetical protein
MASGVQLAVFKAQDQEFQGTDYARRDRRGEHPVLDFALTEIAYFSFVLADSYEGGGITVNLHYAMTTATANDIRLNTFFERIGEVQDMDSEGFDATGVTGTDDTVPGSAGVPAIVSNAHSNGARIDSLVVGEGGRLKVVRAAVAGTDATGDLEIRFIELVET